MGGVWTGRLKGVCTRKGLAYVGRLKGRMCNLAFEGRLKGVCAREAAKAPWRLKAFEGRLKNGV